MLAFHIPSYYQPTNYQLEAKSGEYLIQCLSVAVQRGNATIVLGSMGMRLNYLFFISSFHFIIIHKKIYTINMHGLFYTINMHGLFYW